MLSSLGRRGRFIQQSGEMARLLSRAQLTVAGAVTITFAIVDWIVARKMGSRPLFMFAYGAALVLIGTWAASRRRLALNVERSRLPARVREGQPVSVDLVLTAGRRASTLIVEEGMPEPFGEPPRLPVASIAAGETVEHSYTFSPARRGVYDLGPVTATWSDPFGLTTHQQELASAETIIVHPRVELVHDRVLTRMWEDPPIRPPASKPWPTGFEFYGMRDYVPGDDMRRVVWTAAARTGRLLVRESEQGITDRVCIFLDTGKEWHQPGEPSDTFETAVRIAASLCARHIGDGFAVTLHTNDDALAESVRGPRARFTLLDELAKVGMSSAHLTDAGPRMLKESRRGAHFAVITPHLDRKFADQLRLVIERGASVAVIKLVWDESDPLSWANAARLGCQVIPVAAGSSLEGAFARQLQRVGGRG